MDVGLFNRGYEAKQFVHAGLRKDQTGDVIAGVVASRDAYAAITRNCGELESLWFPFEIRRKHPAAKPLVHQSAVDRRDQMPAYASVNFPDEFNIEP